MRFLTRVRPTGVRKDRLLSAIRSIGGSFGAEIRNPKWTSYGALEVDVFTRSKADFDLFSAAVGPVADLEFATDLNRSSPHRKEEDLFAEARELFNAERYWECHEVLEGAWRREHGEVKRLLQGIILVCAAFVHHQKGEDGVALSVLARGANQLDYPADVFHGIAIPPLRAEARSVLTSGRFRPFRI